MEIVIKRNEYKYENELALYINLMMIIDLLRRSFNFVNLSFEYDSEIQSILYIIIFCKLLYKAYRIKRKFMNVILAGGLSICIFLYGLIMEPLVGKIFVISLLNYFILVFGTCIFIKEMKNTEILINCCNKYIYVCLLYCLMVALTQSTQKFSTYSMTFSFNCFFPLGLSLVLAFFEKKWINLIYAIVIFGVNMAIGSRSIVIYSVMIGTGIYFFLSRRKYYWLKGLIGIAVVYLALDYERITSSIGMMLLKFFPTSRTVKLLSNGGLFKLSGREIYFNIIASSIADNPFVMHGLLTDRILIGNTIGHTTYVTEYPHNIFLEVFYQHGIILGSIFFLFIFILIVKSISISLKDEGKWDIALMIIAVSFALSQLLVSNSYIISMSFGLLIGTSLCLIQHGKGMSV